ncbi:hypothetical protein BSKO_06146 [Bryopsis sp. KO-2023]|nr:hypothetical protein BSKO_06146 [Bryopsis sp. KO-2023]
MLVSLAFLVIVASPAALGRSVHRGELCDAIGCLNEKGLALAQRCKEKTGARYVGVLLGTPNPGYCRTIEVQDWFLKPENGCDNWEPSEISGACMRTESILCNKFKCRGTDAALVSIEYASGACQNHYGVFSDDKLSGICGAVPENLVRTCPVLPKSERDHLGDEGGDVDGE